jgi:hypothetical protein
VLYLADAGVLTAGGTFKPSEADPRLFDTMESAQLLLHNLMAAHEPTLAQLRAPSSARSLAEVACAHASRLSLRIKSISCFCMHWAAAQPAICPDLQHSPLAVSACPGPLQTVRHSP